MILRKLVVLILCGSFLAALFGGGKKDKYILDGPGMINPASWESFTVSRSDSYAQHNFYIKVEVRNEGLVVTGEVRGEDGTIYEEEDGILLPQDASLAIYALEPALLPAFQVTEEQPLDEGDEAVALDQSSVSIEVFCTDGRILQCVDEDDFSIMVYEIVMPHFASKYN